MYILVVCIPIVANNKKVIVFMLFDFDIANVKRKYL